MFSSILFHQYVNTHLVFSTDKIRYFKKDISQNRDFRISIYPRPRPPICLHCSAFICLVFFLPFIGLLASEKFFNPDEIPNYTATISHAQTKYLVFAGSTNFKTISYFSVPVTRPNIQYNILALIDKLGDLLKMTLL